MTDADILLEDIIGENDYDNNTISILSVFCGAMTGTKTTEEGENDEG